MGASGERDAREAAARYELGEGRAVPGRMTFEEFLAWADEDTRAEWVDGEVVPLTPASRRHQLVADFLLSHTWRPRRHRGMKIVLYFPWAAP